jgi:hypothetical protein
MNQLPRHAVYILIHMSRYPMVKSPLSIPWGFRTRLQVQEDLGYVQTRDEAINIKSSTPRNPEINSNAQHK